MWIGFSSFSIYVIFKKYIKSYKSRLEQNKLDYYNRIYEIMYKKYDLLSNPFNAYKILNIPSSTNLNSDQVHQILCYLYKKYDPEHRDEIIDSLLEEN